MLSENKSLKTAVVIFSRNAATDNDWKAVLQAYAMQNFPVQLKLLVDSESDDSTLNIAKEFNWEILSIKADSFNHGLTRQMAVEKLRKDNFDTAVFATQDTIPANPDTLRLLAESLEKQGAAAAYARQMPVTGTGMDAFFRQRNYPEKSRLKSIHDSKELGLMTPFCSNSLAAWNLKFIEQAGGFVKTSFGEDILMAAKLLQQGEKIFYCAESKCFHEHKNSIYQVFKRGVDIGTMHRNFPELKKNFGSIESFAERIPTKAIIRYIIPLAIKYTGSLLGRFCFFLFR